MRPSKKTNKKTAGRTKRAKARRPKTKRVGAVRAVKKPKAREDQIKWAENLGFEALCEVTGGAGKAIRGAAATHGGAVQIAGCCGWSRFIKGGTCSGGNGIAPALPGAPGAPSIGLPKIGIG